MDENLTNMVKVTENTSDESIDESPTRKYCIGQGHEKEAGQKLQKACRRGRRRKKARPVQDLTWEERRALEDRESQRALARRENLEATGHPMAPYNTTQFLMEDRKQSTPDLKRRSDDHVFEPEGETGNLHDEYLANAASNTSANDYILEDFSHEYKDMHMQYLRDLPRERIVADYLELETKVERLEKTLRRCVRKHGSPDARTAMSVSGAELSSSADSNQLQRVAERFNTWQQEQRIARRDEAEGVEDTGTCTTAVNSDLKDEEVVTGSLSINSTTEGNDITALSGLVNGVTSPIVNGVGGD